MDFTAWLKERVLERLDKQANEIISELQPIVDTQFPGDIIKAGTVRGWQTTARRERERRANSEQLRDQVSQLRSMVEGLATAPAHVVNLPQVEEPSAQPAATQGDDEGLSAYRSQMVTHYVRPTDGSWEAYQYCIERRKTCVLVGEAGTGKSTMAEVGLVLAGLDPVEITCDRNTEREDFFGRTNLVADDGVQITEDQYGVLVVAATQGRPLIINEIGNVPSGSQSALFAAAEQKPFRNPLNSEVIVPRRGFALVGTANHLNLGDQREIEYDTGRMSLAFRSRMSMIIPVPYLPPAKEVDMIIRWTGADRNTAEKAVQFGNLTRDMMRNDVSAIRVPVCSRVAKELAEYLTAGGTIQDGLRYVVLGRMPEDSHTKIEEAAHAVWSF